MTIFKTSHLVWGVWIEMSSGSKLTTSSQCHTSYEVCGLKFSSLDSTAEILLRHTSYEVCGLKFRWWSYDRQRHDVTPRMRCVDWNMLCMGLRRCEVLVTSHTKCVDWNVWIVLGSSSVSTVTPCMRCVDWNGSPESVECDVRPGHTSYEVCGLK